MRWILQISSERTGTDVSAVKHQSHQPSSSIFSSEARGEFFKFFFSTDLSSIYYIEGTFVTLSPTLMDPALVSVVRAVDGQETGLSVQLAEKKNRLQTGQEFHLQSALVQASLLLKHQLTGQQKERDLWRHIQSANRVSSRSWSRDFPPGHEDKHVIHRTRRSEVHSLHSRLLWFQFLVPVIYLQRTGTDFSATDISRPVSLRLLWYKERTRPVRAYPRSWSRDSPTSSRSRSSSPISQSRCPSDQQVGHVTHQTTNVSKYSSQGLSQQLSNLRIRYAF